MSILSVVDLVKQTLDDANAGNVACCCVPHELCDVLGC